MKSRHRYSVPFLQVVTCVEVEICIANACHFVFDSTNASTRYTCDSTCMCVTPYTTEGFDESILHGVLPDHG